MLLLDENLSARLIAGIADTFPDSLHVIHAGLDNAPDMEIWHFAKVQKLAIVTKDSDFLNFARQHGSPPEVIYLQTGNCRLALIEQLLKENQGIIEVFLQEPGQGVLILKSEGKSI